MPNRLIDANNTFDLELMTTKVHVKHPNIYASLTTNDACHSNAAKTQQVATDCLVSLPSTRTSVLQKIRCFNGHLFII